MIANAPFNPPPHLGWQSWGPKVETQREAQTFVSFILYFFYDFFPDFYPSMGKIIAEREKDGKVTFVEFPKQKMRTISERGHGS